MTSNALAIAGGLLLLVVGGDALVRGAAQIARRLGVSPLVVGIVLVGFGTSTPELVTSLVAAGAGSPGIAVGNVVGSNTANLLLILGLAALLRPIPATPLAFKRDGAALAVSALLCLAAVWAGRMGRLAGAAFLVALGVYIAVAIKTEPRREGDAEPAPDRVGRLPLAAQAAIFGAGLGATVLGARLLVGGAIGIARAAGISETVIGVTIVAIGTSLPELTASAIAAARRRPEIALGNIMGSSIYNVLGILGVTAVVHPIEVPPEILARDIWVMLAATAALLICPLTRWRIGRAHGAVLLGAYAAYLAVLAYNS